MQNLRVCIILFSPQQKTPTFQHKFLPSDPPFPSCMHVFKTWAGGHLAQAFDAPTRCILYIHPCRRSGTVLSLLRGHATTCYVRLSPLGAAGPTDWRLF